MPKLSIAEFFIRSLAELRDEQREIKASQLRANIRAYVDRLVHEFRIEFSDSPQGRALAPARRKARPIRLSDLSDK